MLARTVNLGRKKQQESDENLKIFSLTPGRSSDPPLVLPAVSNKPVLSFGGARTD